MHTVRVSGCTEPCKAHTSLQWYSSTQQPSVDSSNNVQPNFSQMLNMDRLSIQDTNESGFSTSHASAEPPSSRKSSKKNEIISSFVHSVKRNPEIFKSGRERLSRAPTFCEVPDALLAARAARIIMKRGNSHRPPPTRYIRRQRSAIEPRMIVTTSEGEGTSNHSDALERRTTPKRTTPMRSESENHFFLNACFEVRFGLFPYFFP